MPLAAAPLREEALQMTKISRRTMEEHYKLYEGYVKKSNEILEKLQTADPTSANQVFSETRALKVELSFALNGMRNHELYFSHLGGDGQPPDGQLKHQIEKDFGSVDRWRVDLKASGLSARGWVWLCYDHRLEQLINYVGDTQNTYSVWFATPVMALDVYEHAYFIDFGTDRAGYIDAFCEAIDWSVIETGFADLVK